MAIRLIDQYPNRVGTPSADYPHGEPRNRSTPGAVDGTPFEQAWFRDQEGFFQGLLESAGITPSGVPDTVQNSDYLDALFFAIREQSQFGEYSNNRTYVTGDIVRGSDGVFYEFYDRDQTGTSQGQDPANPVNRPHIWMEWDGVKPGSTIEWRSETLPEGYVENDGAEISRADYRRIYAVHGTTYGAGDGSTTFLLPDDRGEFKRGWDNGRGVDGGRGFATHQKGTLFSYDNSTGETTVDTTRGTPSSVQVDPISALDYPGASRSYVNEINGATSDGISPASVGATRPRNNAVIYLTKI